MKTERDSLKYRMLLETGQRLFWKHGFRRVTIDEICRDADVSKMTFYRFFENKIDLAKTIFRNVAEEGIKKFNEVIDSDAAPSEKLKLIISMKAEGTNDISREFLMDFYNSADTELPMFVEKVTSNAWKEVIEGFRRAQEDGWLRKDFKPEFLFHLSQKLMGMVTDKELLKMYNNQQDLILEFANFFTYGISTHD
jgi:AcrR family transcriptional regulator